MDAPELHVVDVGRAFVGAAVEGAVAERGDGVLELLLEPIVRRLAREHDAELAREAAARLVALKVHEHLDELVPVVDVDLGLHEHGQAAPQPRHLALRRQRARAVARVRGRRQGRRRRAAALAHLHVGEGRVVVAGVERVGGFGACCRRGALDTGGRRRVCGAEPVSSSEG